MTKFSISQLLDNQSRLAQKAIKCQALGLVKTVDVTTEIYSAESWKLKVAVNEYYGEGHSWTAMKKDWGDDQAPHYDEENMVVLEELLDQTIADARAKAQDIINLLEA